MTTKELHQYAKEVEALVKQAKEVYRLFYHSDGCETKGDCIHDKALAKLKQSADKLS